MTRQWLASLILLCTWVASAEAAVTLKGLTATDAIEVVKKYPSLKSDRPTLADLDRAIRLLMLTEIYSNVRAERDEKGDFTLVGEQLQKLQDIQISGLQAFDRDEVLAAMNLKPGVKFDDSKVAEAEDRLKEFYGRRGYLNTITSFKIDDLPSGDVMLRVRVREREPCVIEDIEFVSNEENPTLEARLRRSASSYFKKNFTESNVSSVEAEVQEYLSQNRYLNTTARQKEARYNSNRTAVTLVYQLSDVYSYEVILSGYKHYSLNQILRNLKLDEFARGSADPSQEIAQKVKDFYVTTGFTHAKVVFEERPLPKTFIKRIMIDIEEGLRVRLVDIDIVGRISRSTRHYAEFIRENSSDVVEDGYYVRNDLDNGFKNLVVNLNNEGFLRAKIQSSRVEFDKTRSQARVTVVMDEGPLTQLSKIVFSGHQAYDAARLLEVLDIPYNAPLRLNSLSAGIERLKQFYYDNGFIEMKILNEIDNLVEYDDKGLQATVNMKLSEGPQVYVKSIIVEGNSFTKDYVVLREINIRAGDLLTPSLLDEAQKRLDKLAIFSRVELRTLEAGTSISQRTLVVSVTERNPGLFKFGAGVTNKREITIRGFGGVSYTNIGGTARAVSLRGTLEQSIADSKYLEYEIGAGYLEPFLFDQMVRGRVGYTRSKKIAEVRGEEGTETTDTLSFAIEKDITSRIKFTWHAWALDVVYLELFERPDDGRQRERQEIAYLGPSLDVDYRDNPFLPTRGTYGNVNVDYSSPDLGSSDKIEFVRTQGTLSHYLRLGSPRLVWANSYRAGYEKNLNREDGSGVPLSFAFFLGGYNTIRGYSGVENDRIPSSRDYDNPDSLQLIVPDESVYQMLKSELRFPLPIDSMGNVSFGGVLFYDAGRVDVQGVNFERPFRHSYGTGIRVNTPVGPISLDYARKIAPLKDESPDQWHLSIGTF